MSENKTCCPNCGSTEAVPKEVAWDALASIPPKTQAALLAADELARAFDSSGNVTERHARACHALVAYRARRATGAGA